MYFVPSSFTDAPTKGSPVLVSTTLPLITWELAANPKNKSKKSVEKNTESFGNNMFN
jgi:hypothetical protein